MGYRLLIGLLLAVTAGYLILARQIPLGPWSAEELVNSRTLPTLFGSLLTLVLLGLMFTQPPGVLRFGTRAQGIRFVALLALFGSFIGLLQYAGIWLALAALLLAALLIMGERRVHWLLALSAGIPLGGWLLVERWLGVYVPGIFPGMGA
jgi:hypothetical protein